MTQSQYFLDVQIWKSRKVFRIEVFVIFLDVPKLLIVKNIVRNTLIAGCVQMVTCLFPCKGEENTEMLNTYLTVLERDIFKVSINQ